MTISRSLCVRTKRYLRYKKYFFGRGEDRQISEEYEECPYSHCLPVAPASAHYYTCPHFTVYVGPCALLLFSSVSALVREAKSCGESRP